VKIAIPCPDFTLCKQIPHLFFVKRRLDLRSEKVEGDRGEDGFDRLKNPELCLVLHFSFGLTGADSVVITSAAAVVLHLSPELESDSEGLNLGVEGFEKNPNPNPPLFSCFSFRSRVIDLQNALRHPNTIFKAL
jgi:hypothetical protein